MSATENNEVDAADQFYSRIGLMTFRTFGASLNATDVATSIFPPSSKGLCGGGHSPFRSCLADERMQLGKPLKYRWL